MHSLCRTLRHTARLTRLRPVIQPALSSACSTYDNSNARNAALTWTVAGLATCALSAAWSSISLAEAAPEDPDAPKSYPTITREEVSKHVSKETGIWVTYRGGVYDITEFVDIHPGGMHRIILAAGGAVDPYWNMYAVHKSAAKDLIEEYRIGTLPPEEAISADSFADPYANDPQRDPRLVVRSATPFNAETPPAVLTSSFITPTELHFKRHHLPVPDAIESAYALELSGGTGTTKTLGLEDVRQLPSRTITMTLQCAGNRRREMSEAREVKGLFWDQGAISTATWTGVLLKDLLAAQGLLQPQELEGVQHVQFQGLDADGEGNSYGASVPLRKVLDDYGDVLVAYEMNGQPLTRDHGYPLRVVVPGTVAARSVKWVSKIRLSAEESDSHWQQEDYKGFCPDEDWAALDWSKSPAIQETPVTSAILSPRAGSAVPTGAGSVEVEGYAFAGGGRNVVRVDVSGDGGKTWRPAQLDAPPQPYKQAWAWRRWSVAVPLPADGEVEVVCKAVDDSYNSQPENVEPIYNMRGVLSHAWHRVKLERAASAA